MHIRIKSSSLPELQLFKDKVYPVTNAGRSEEGAWFYGVFNDRLQHLLIDESLVELTDNSLTGYLRNDESNQDREHYLHELVYSMIGSINTINHTSLDSHWLRSKLYPFLKEYYSPLPEKYLQDVLDEKGKLKFIEGYLQVINELLEEVFSGGHYTEQLAFYREDAEEPETLISSEDDLTPLDKSDYRSKMTQLIENLFSNLQSGEVKVPLNATSLFRYIDAVFVSPVEGFYSYQTHYDDCLIIRCQGKHYYLNKFWFG